MPPDSLSFYLRDQRSPRDARKNVPARHLSLGCFILICLLISLIPAEIGGQEEFTLQKMLTVPRWGAIESISGPVNATRTLTSPGSVVSALNEMVGAQHNLPSPHTVPRARGCRQSPTGWVD